MQYSQEVAYVLRRFLPNRQKTALLTYSLGRVNVTFNHKTQGIRLWPGMLLTCTMQRDNSFWVAHNVAIQAAPIPQTHHNIFWLHHILELCYYFLPLEHPAPDVFGYVKQCCFLMWQSEELDDTWQIFIKKVCVIKLLGLFGFYRQEDIQEYSALFRELSALFIDFTNEQKVEFLKKRYLCFDMEKMNEWILSCLKSHPMFTSFKTVSFNY